MVGHLDNELQQLRETLASREDMEARRVALYKQADAKIEAAAQAARFVEAQKNATGTVTPTTAPREQSSGLSGQQSAARPTAPAPPSAAPPTNKPASPN